MNDSVNTNDSIEFDEKNSAADAIAAVVLILVFVSCCIFWISIQ